MAVNLQPGWRPGLAATGLISATFTFATMAYRLCCAPTVGPVVPRPAPTPTAHTELPLSTVHERDYCFPLNGTIHGCLIGYSQCETPDDFFDSSNGNTRNAPSFVHLLVLFLELFIICVLLRAWIRQQSRKYHAVERHHMVAAFKNAWIWNFFGGIGSAYALESNIYSFCDTVGASIHGPSRLIASLMSVAFASVVATYWTANAACERSRIELAGMEAQRTDKTKDEELETAHKAIVSMKHHFKPQQHSAGRLRASNKRQQHDIHKLHAVRERQRDNNKLVARRVSTLQRQHTVMVAANDKLEKTKIKLTGDLQSLSAAIDSHDIKIKQLENDLGTSKAENEALKSDMKAKSSESDILTLDVQTKRKQIERLSAANRDIQENKLKPAWEQQDKLERQNRGLERQKAELETKLQTSHEEREKLSRKIQELERQINDLDTKLLESSEECALAKQATCSAQAEVKKSVALIDELSRETTAGQTSLKTQQSLVESLQGQLQTEQDNMRKLGAINKGLTRELELLKDHLAPLKQQIQSLLMTDEDKSKTISNLLAEKTATQARQQQKLDQMASLNEDVRIKLALSEADCSKNMVLLLTANEHLGARLDQSPDFIAHFEAQNEPLLPNLRHYRPAANKSGVLSSAGPISPTATRIKASPETSAPEIGATQLHTALPRLSSSPSTSVPEGEFAFNMPGVPTSLVDPAAEVGSAAAFAVSDVLSTSVNMDRSEARSLLSTATTSESAEICPSGLVKMECPKDTALPSTATTSETNEAFLSSTAAPEAPVACQSHTAVPSGRPCYYRKNDTVNNKKHICKNYVAGTCVGNPDDYNDEGAYKYNTPNRYGTVGTKTQKHKKSAAYDRELCSDCYKRWAIQNAAKNEEIGNKSE